MRIPIVPCGLALPVPLALIGSLAARSTRAIARVPACPRSETRRAAGGSYTRTVTDAASDAGPIAPAASTAPEWRWALPRILGLFVATRLLLLAIAIAAETTQASPAAGLRWSDAPLLASLTSWDGRYYLGIATSGYHAAPVFGPFVDYVFFPLYPALVRVASVLTLGSIDLAGVLVANACLGLALVALYALSIRHLSRDAALRALVFLCLAPGAVAFGLAYTDSLFLLLAVGAFLAAETRRVALMGLLFALATLTRPPGILLALPLLVLILRDPALRARRAWAWLVLGPIALAGFVAFTWALTGDALAIVRGQAIWSQPGLAVTLPQPDGSTYVWTGGPLWIGLVWLGCIAFYGVLLAYFRRDRISAAYGAVAILALLEIVAAGRIRSAPRYLATAWPFDWVLARRGPVVRYAVLVVFVAGQCALAWEAFTWSAAP